MGRTNENEIQKAVSDQSVDALPDIRDADYAAWLFDLWDILTCADEEDSDIVTLYY